MSNVIFEIILKDFSKFLLLGNRWDYWWCRECRCQYVEICDTDCSMRRMRSNVVSNTNYSNSYSCRQDNIVSLICAKRLGRRLQGIHRKRSSSLKAFVTRNGKRLMQICSLTWVSVKKNKRVLVNTKWWSFRLYWKWFHI